MTSWKERIKEKREREERLKALRKELNLKPQKSYKELLKDRIQKDAAYRCYKKI